MVQEQILEVLRLQYVPSQSYFILLVLLYSLASIRFVEEIKILVICEKFLLFINNSWSIQPMIITYLITRCHLDNPVKLDESH
jgi:hypothetical protein